MEAWEELLIRPSQWKYKIIAENQTGKVEIVVGPLAGVLSCQAGDSFGNVNGTSSLDWDVLFVIIYWITTGLKTSVCADRFGGDKIYLHLLTSYPPLVILYLLL